MIYLSLFITVLVFTIVVYTYGMEIMKYMKEKQVFYSKEYHSSDDTDNRIWLFIIIIVFFLILSILLPILSLIIYVILAGLLYLRNKSNFKKLIEVLEQMDWEIWK